MINIFQSVQIHCLLFCNFVGNKYSIYASLIYHLIVFIITIVLISKI